MLTPGQKYRHYKGKMYEIIALGRDSDTTEEVVVYRALYDSPEYGNNSVWVRARKEFVRDVVVDGVQRRRFEEVS